MTRRAVRVTPEFFVQLDRQLPAERGAHGEPTVAEFAASDLLIIVERFAVLWDSLPMPIAGRPDYRDLILTTRLVPYVSIRGQLAPDDAIELIDIDIDLRGLRESAPCPSSAAARPSSTPGHTSRSARIAASSASISAAMLPA